MECPVCLEIYNIPLLLPGCGHTICQICAEALVTEGNFLKCPECRLVYQLRRGVKSLPKNVALQRTIEDYQKRSINSTRSNTGPMCESHPEDNVTLYCRTCEKSICLKCYFTNTIRKGESLHTGHQVDTSEDMLSREKRLLEDVCKNAESFQKEESVNLKNLKDIDDKLNKILDTKKLEIETNRNELTNAVKLTASKLIFNLTGSIAKEKDQLKESIEISEKKIISMRNAVEDAIHVLNVNIDEKTDIKALKNARKKIEDASALKQLDKGQIFEHVNLLEKFDTDIQSCLDDPKKALAYQSGRPKIPSFILASCIISSTSVLIPVHYHESVRVRYIELKYRESAGCVGSDKDWKSVRTRDFGKGLCRIILSGLLSDTTYKCFAISANDFGESENSVELVFRTLATNAEVWENH